MTLVLRIYVLAAKIKIFTSIWLRNTLTIYFFTEFCTEFAQIIGYVILEYISLSLDGAVFSNFSIFHLFFDF